MRVLQDGRSAYDAGRLFTRAADAPPLVTERPSWRPQRPWHVYELLRTGAACAGVATQTAILLRVFGAL